MMEGSSHFAEKHPRSNPFFIFYTPSSGSDVSCTFSDVIDRDLGIIASSVHVSHVVDLEWLLSIYAECGQSTTMHVVGSCVSQLDNNVHNKEVKVTRMLSNHVFSTVHHAKFSILEYIDGSMRLIITSANLSDNDWTQHVNGVWISPRLKLLPEDAGYTDGECPTFFKSDFIRFLRAYSEMAPELVDQIIPRLKRMDFSAINCFFIGSVPGVHSCDNDEDVYWGHERVGRILEDHACLPNYDVGRCCIVMQSSSIGSVGDNADNNWLTGEFTRALSAVFVAENTNDAIDTIKTPIFLIYPSVRDLSNGSSLNNCLCYSSETHARQHWISKYLCRWRNNAAGGAEIAPHVKCFLRTDPTFTIASWFLLTSGNISQAAWGKLNSRGGLYVKNFEAGVLLLPSFVTGNTAFPLATLNGSIETFNKDVASLIVPFDLPPVRYSPGTDEPCFKQSTDLNLRQRNRSPCKDKHLRFTISKGDEHRAEEIFPNLSSVADKVVQKQSARRAQNGPTYCDVQSLSDIQVSHDVDSYTVLLKNAAALKILHYLMIDVRSYGARPSK
ncbi:unnamed protein product [Ceutorhynchus assimilis]|uniref:Tyrosyl-DNA phosphodiesterase n=1 Tax=Ceutorhynchus assimilis TaxID=467358 RepID=A0A9P0DMT8_9CUCU|nr:unnamed protein product [Ceutorhynchus assimilis]